MGEGSQAGRIPGSRRRFNTFDAEATLPPCDHGRLKTTGGGCDEASLNVRPSLEMKVGAGNFA